MTSIYWETPRVPGAHEVIEGDSRDVLPLLEGTFDLAYLDPPYATSSTQLSYSDSLDVEAWCGMFRDITHKTLALLNPARPCPVLVSIDDHRIIQARTILDQQLPGGYVATVVVEGSVRPGARLVSVGHEYLLIYTTLPSVLRKTRTKWRVPKPEAATILNQAAKTWNRHAPNQQSASQAMRSWYRQHETNPEIWRLREYKWYTPTGRLFRRGPLSAPRGSRHYYYEIITPDGRVFTPDRWGWRMPQATWQNWQDTNQVDWGQQPGMIPARCLFLDEHCSEPPGSVERTWQASNTRYNAQYAHRTGFSYPKNPQLLAKWIQTTTLNNPDIRVVEPFAGTCPTIQALEALNQQDSGTRRATCIQIREHVQGETHTIFDTVTIPSARHATTRLNIGRLRKP